MNPAQFRVHIKAYLNVFVYRVRSPFLVIPCGIGDT
jgi:hypothetical protein